MGRRCRTSGVGGRLEGYWARACDLIKDGPGRCRYLLPQVSGLDVAEEGGRRNLNVDHGRLQVEGKLDVPFLHRLTEIT